MRWDVWQIRHLDVKVNQITRMLVLLLKWSILWYILLPHPHPPARPGLYNYTPQPIHRPKQVGLAWTSHAVPHTNDKMRCFSNNVQVMWSRAARGASSPQSPAATVAFQAIICGWGALVCLRLPAIYQPRGVPTLNWYPYLKISSTWATTFFKFR